VHRHARIAKKDQAIGANGDLAVKQSNPEVGIGWKGQEGRHRQTDAGGQDRPQRNHLNREEKRLAERVETDLDAYVIEFKGLPSSSFASDIR
jgi:hypothetical protein